jgi:hypothetical protein
MKPKTIEELRRSNYKVRVIHRSVKPSDAANTRLELVDDGDNSVTEITVTDPSAKYTATGFAYRSKRDMHNRKLGNMIALGRAMKALKEKMI